MRIVLLNRLNLDKTFEINALNIKSVVSIKPKELSFSIPLGDVENDLNLEIINIFSEDFRFVDEFGETIESELGVHYRGKISGKLDSFVSLSFFDEKIAGTVHSSSQKFDITQIEGLTYTTKLVSENLDFNCQVDNIVENEYPEVSNQHNEIKSIPLGLNPYVTATTINCVRCFWEIDHDIYLFHLTGTTSHIASLFAASAVLFFNDGINIVLSEVKIWTNGFAPYRTYGSPVANCDCPTVLSNYRAYYINNSLSFNGDFTHYMTYNYPCAPNLTSGSRCGVSYVNGTCISSGKFSQSQLYYSTNVLQFPTFSWNVYVISHEQGHQFGSPHTHRCAWNGNNTAIDGCAPIEGSCPNPGLPVGGGTIMSYCNQTSVDINFTLGFGPQPQSRIVSLLNSKTCLLPCGPLPTPIPTFTPTLTPNITKSNTPTKTPTKTINFTQTPTLTSNWPCSLKNRFTPPFSVGISAITVNGVTFTSTSTGDILSATTRSSGCLPIGQSTPIGVRMSTNGLNASYTLISNAVLNSITLRFVNLSFYQTITITTNAGLASISLCDGCCSSVSGNTIYADFCEYSELQGWSRIVVVTSTLSFNSLTITTTNPYPSRLTGIVFDIINFSTVFPSVTETNTPTQTNTPTKTKTVGLSPNPTLTPTITPTITSTQTLTPTTTVTSNFCNPYNCNTPIRPPMTVNGVFITSSLTGTSLNMPVQYSSCNGSVISPPNILGLGYSSPFTYSLNFSTPISSIVMYITAGGIINTACTETFTVNTNSGTPSITSPTNCFTTINNNVITMDPEGSSQVGAAGGIFLISNSTPFTSVSVSGLRVCAGSYIVFCGDSLICPPSLPTQTPTLTPTITQTLTPTITPTLTSNIQIIPKVDFVCVSWFNGPSSTQFINFLNGILNLYNKPIWVIEFAAQSIESAQLQPNLYSQSELNDFINTVVSWMNNNDMVERFSWKDSKSGTSSIFTIDGQLTETGITYRDAQ